MKIFFDTNDYVAEALLGTGAEAMIAATVNASWRIFVNSHVLDEVERVLIEEFEFSRRFALMTRSRIVRRTTMVESPTSRHKVPGDDADSPILRAAISVNADYLVSNDRHLLNLDPYHGLRVVAMTEYRQLLIQHGLLPLSS